MAVSIKDIARAVGVSNVAVSMALRNHPEISVARRKQIKETARKMGYQPNRLARSLRLKKSSTIGVLIGGLRYSINGIKLQAIEKEFSKLGYKVLIGFTQSDPKITFDYVQELVARQVDGLIVASMADYESQALYHRFLGNIDVPFIIFDAVIPTTFPSVSTDRKAGMRRVVEYLAQIGHRDIAYADAHLVPTSKLEGAQEAVSEMPHVRFRQIHFSFLNDDNFEDVVDTAMQVAVMPDRPTAVILPSDILAIPFIQGLQQAGSNVPGDISVTGFDCGREGMFFKPALTTVRQPAEELAKKAAELFVSMMNGDKDVQRAPANIMVVPELVIRDSTAPLKQ
ncbi:MAG: LacI family DNA-binding transcriptional regulator [Kiritimatiellae bacterium]|nr:LacI family DNA-binding transcriptional regulator [Kiritimatiellia bacterium]